MRWLAGPVTAAAACVLLGLATGAATVALHPAWWGLVLGLAASSAAVIALPALWFTRPMFAVGWALPVGLGAGRRPEGDYLIAADLAGYLLLAMALLLLAFSLLSVATARRTETGPDADGDSRIAG